MLVRLASDATQGSEGLVGCLWGQLRVPRQRTLSQAPANRKWMLISDVSSSLSSEKALYLPRFFPKARKVRFTDKRGNFLAFGSEKKRRAGRKHVSRKRYFLQKIKMQKPVSIQPTVRLPKFV